MPGLLIGMNSLDACDDIAEGMDYVEKIKYQSNKRSSLAAIDSILSFITASLSLGTSAANYPKPTGMSGQVTYQLTIKNNSLLILIPASILTPRQAPGIPRGAYFTHAPRILFPGEECQYRVETARRISGLHRFVFFGITTDPTLVAENALPQPNEILRIEICVRLGSSDANRTQLEYIQIGNERITPTTTWGASDLMYATHRRRNQSKEASFGMAFYGTQYSNLQPFEVISNVLVFTPSGKTDLDRPLQQTPPTGDSIIPGLPDVTPPLVPWSDFVPCLLQSDETPDDVASYPGVPFNTQIENAAIVF